MRALATAVLSLLVGIAAGLGQAIPEPGFLLLGSVTRDATGPVRLTQGRLTLTIRSGLGEEVSVSTELGDLGGGYSYTLVVPFETVFGGGSPSANTFRLVADGDDYRLSRIDVELEGVVYGGAVMDPQGSDFHFGKADRGRWSVLDITVLTEQDNAYAAWCLEHFGQVVDRGADSDDDGATNQDEYLAGTDPNDATSTFRIIEAKSPAGGPLLLRWASQTGRVYFVLRSEQRVAGPYTQLAGNLAATPPVNTYTDAAPSAGTARFYQIQTNPEAGAKPEFMALAAAEVKGAALTSGSNSVSADASVSTGGSPPTWCGEAVRWSATGAVNGLAELPCGPPGSEAKSASADGLTVVGTRNTPQGDRAFLWTQESGLQYLGVLPGKSESGAEDITADGQIVVGSSGDRALVWDAIQGMRDLQEELAARFGLAEQLTGWQLSAAKSISDDGTEITGTGIDPHGRTTTWLARGLDFHSTQRH